MGLFWKSKAEKESEKVAEESRRRQAEEEKRKQIEVTKQKAEECINELRAVLAKVKDMNPGWKMYEQGDYRMWYCTPENIWVNIHDTIIPHIGRLNERAVEITIEQKTPDHDLIPIFKKTYSAESEITKESYRILYTYLADTVIRVRNAVADIKRQQEEQARNQFWNS